MVVSNLPAQEHLREQNLPLRLLTETLFGVLKTAARWLLLTFVCIHKSSTKVYPPLLSRRVRAVVSSSSLVDKRKTFLLLFRFRIFESSRSFSSSREGGKNASSLSSSLATQKKRREKSPPPPLPFAERRLFFYGRLALLLEGIVVRLWCFCSFFAHSFSSIFYYHEAFVSAAGQRRSSSRNTRRHEERTLFSSSSSSSCKGGLKKVPLRPLPKNTRVKW